MHEIAQKIDSQVLQLHAVASMLLLLRRLLTSPFKSPSAVFLHASRGTQATGECFIAGNDMTFLLS